MNTFEFNNTFYIQTHGTAMGTRMAPSYANLFLAKFETDALTHAPHQPYTWWRFIDDIFMIWTHTEDELRTFITYLNNIHPTIKFTSSHSATSISFLDVKVSLSQFGVLETDLYTKPTEKHQYLLQSSCHPLHTKRAIPFSLKLSDYGAYALPTKASLYAPMNSSNTLTIVDTTFLFSEKKSNEFMQSHATKHLSPVRLPQANPVAFRLSSHTTLPFVLYIISYKDILKSFHPPLDATASFKPHLLLLSHKLTTLVTFWLDLSYILINKLSSLRDPSDAAKIASLAAILPMAALIIHFLLLGK